MGGAVAAFVIGRLLGPARMPILLSVMVSVLELSTRQAIDHVMLIGKTMNFFIRCTIVLSNEIARERAMLRL